MSASKTPAPQLRDEYNTMTAKSVNKLRLQGIASGEFGRIPKPTTKKIQSRKSSQPSLH